MFCKNCGAEIDDNAYVCPKCGVLTGGNKTIKADDAPSKGFAVLSFFIPLIGLILYFVWKAEYPQKARSCGKGALIGVCVSVGFSILYSIIVGALIGGMVGAM